MDLVGNGESVVVEVLGLLASQVGDGSERGGERREPNVRKLLTLSRGGNQRAKEA